MNNLNSTNNQKTYKLAQYLIRKKIISNQLQARQLSLIIMVAVIALSVMVFWWNIGDDLSNDIDPKYYYDPSRDTGNDVL